MRLSQVYFQVYSHFITEWINFKEHFGLFQNESFYTKLIIFFFSNGHKCFNFEMDNPNNHFMV